MTRPPSPTRVAQASPSKPLPALPSLAHVHAERSAALPSAPCASSLRHNLSLPVAVGPANALALPVRRSASKASLVPSCAANALPTLYEAEQFRHKFAALQQKVHEQMSPWAREGLAILSNVGKSIAFGAAAVAAWLGLLLAEPHVTLVLAAAGAVWAASIVVGLALELTLKYFAYAKVDAQTRQALTDLCVELNAREKEFRAHRHVDEQHSCDQANLLWAQIHFSRATLLSTLVSGASDYSLPLPRPQAPLERPHAG